MVNLLPIKDRQQIISEYRHRQVMVAGTLLALLIFISALFMIPLWLLLDIKVETLESGQDISTMSLNRREMANLERRVETINQRIKIAQAALSYWTPPEVLDLIDEQVVAGIVVSQITFDQKGDAPVIKLQGSATRRSDLLDFIRSLESSAVIGQVDSPAANLLRETNIDFNLTVTIAK